MSNAQNRLGNIEFSSSLFVWQRDMVLRKDFLSLHTTSSSADRFVPRKECECSEWRSEWGPDYSKPEILLIAPAQAHKTVIPSSQHQMLEPTRHNTIPQQLEGDQPELYCCRTWARVKSSFAATEPWLTCCLRLASGTENTYDCITLMLWRKSIPAPSPLWFYWILV